MDRTEDSLRKLFAALPAPGYDLGILAERGMHRMEGVPAARILRMLPYLKYRNAKGAHIYMRPTGESPYTLLDDLTAATQLSNPRWVTADSGCRYLGFACTRCNHALPPGVWASLLKRNYSREEPSLRIYPLHTLVLHRKITTWPEGHWCHSSRSLFCDSPEWINRGSAVEEQSASAAAQPEASA